MFVRGLVYSLQEGALTLWRNKLISLLSIGTIAISFSILGIFMLVSVNVATLAESYGDTLLIHVFLKDDITPETRSALRTSLEEDKRIESVDYIDKDDAEDRFRELFPNDSEMLDDLEGNYLPASFEANLARDADSDRDSIDELVNEIGGSDGVENVLYDRQWVETLENTGRWFGYAGLALGGLLIFAAIVTTSNIIKLNVLSRREEIEIMRLVGADGIFVRGPFFIGGIIQGLLASGLALGIIYAIFHFGGIFLESVDIELLRNLEFHFLPWEYLVYFILGGLIVGTLASLLSFGRATRI